MRLSLILALAAALLLLTPSVMSAQAGTPKLTAVEPGTGKGGDTFAVTGENLDKSFIAELYLTDGKNDIKVPMVEQTATSIKFTAPKDCKAGRYSLMVLTAGKDPKLIEEPVRLTIE
ncbi:MAG: hypothetical protein SFV54_01815 [Bryobacteraceae bacterium]|nr:hypothetical protein [Bryobacteraceae bacterium]